MSKFFYWRDNLPKPRPYSKVRTATTASERNERTERILNNLPDNDVIELYRLDKEGIDFFAEKLSESEHLKRKTASGISVKCQLLVALKYFATGQSVASLKETCGMGLSAGSVYKSVTNVSAALADMKSEFLSFPTDVETVLETKEGFLRYGQFRGALGAIDGTHFMIKPPSINEDAYVCRKNFHSINCQVICDHELLFTDLVVAWPGSTHDNAIWKHCGVKQLLENYRQETGADAWLLGDSGYPPRDSMMVALDDPQTDAERAYNRSLKRCRCSIERALGTVKSRFRALDRKSSGAIQYDCAVASNIITACFVLHNYCRVRNITISIDPAVLAQVRREMEEDARYHRQHRRAVEAEELDDTNLLIRGIAARQRVIDTFGV